MFSQDNFPPRSKHLLISWLQSPSAVILEPPKIKSVTVSRSEEHTSELQSQQEIQFVKNLRLD